MKVAFWNVKIQVYFTLISSVSDVEHYFDVQGVGHRW